MKAGYLTTCNHIANKGLVMAKCSKCGAKTSFLMNICDECINKINDKVISGIKKDTLERLENNKNRQLETDCNFLIIGVLVLCYGLYNLFNPTIDIENKLISSGIANLHKLFIGSTFSIIGTMLCLFSIKK